MILWGAIGALSALAVEYAFRRYPERAWLDFWPLLPLAVLINYAVFRLMRGSSSLIEGFVLFGIMTALLRLFVSTVLLNEAVGWRGYAALALLLAAKGVQAWR